MRHQSLIPLTHEHHHALAAVRRLRLAAEGSEPHRTHAVRDFLGFFSADTIEHFRDEEERVFPLLVDVIEAEHTLERVMTEHLRIYSAVRSLRRELAEGCASPATMLRVAALLESHIRYEEKVVFPLMETTLTPELLENLSLTTRATASL